ncbi:hypothetical protein P9E76_20510 [Schinkia azotoformans]|uniref:Lipoprotein n=1 Tax=Schinkia azotoformans LMG 9581 TaxID=1131731 RepID=K6E4P5_SCHAZ|nr:hypothetical protein [Schinkia azotoformans]EKN68221.1 hypothetical protein BAZO_05660 [Schinkia azotoformans LMG 9581]MEC1639615.1 hypothetical protein [Schinkia azotoformans]MEC1947378.1 hypothetical protein [Schinkia azotoformans]
MEKRFSFSIINFIKGMFLVPLFFVFFVMSACSSEEAPREIELKPYTLMDLAEQDFAGVDKITIKSGETGEEKMFEDPEQVSNFIKNMEDAYFTPDINQEKRTGWTYWVKLYEGKKMVYEFYPSYVDDIYFKPDEKVIANIEELFNSKK